jgi:hypothetical protein
VLAILIVAGIIAFVVAVPSPEKKTVTVIEHHHHHHTTVVERPIYVYAQVQLIQMKIALAEAKMEPAPLRIPEAKLLNPSTAIERYRSHERKPS